MKVREIMSCPVRSIGSDATLLEAAVKMKSFDIGCLPVIHNGNIAGMITDRDIVLRIVASRLDPAKTRVHKAMTPNPVCCSEDADLQEAARIMEDKQIHRLVVLDLHNEVAGILSIGDIARKVSDAHLLHEVLEKVCEPAGIC